MAGRYEEIRAVRQRRCRETQEMILLMERGLAGWMEAWARYTEPASVVHEGNMPCNENVSGGAPIHDDTKYEALGIVTAMVWSIVKEPCHAQ